MLLLIVVQNLAIFNTTLKINSTHICKREVHTLLLSKYVTGFGKTDQMVTLCISKNIILKYLSSCDSSVLHYSHIRYAV